MITATKGRRRRAVLAFVILVVGTALLVGSFATAQGSPRFYGLTFLSAVTWALGGLLCARGVDDHRLGSRVRLGTLGRDARLPILQPFIVGVALAAIFALGALLVRQLPPLAFLAEDVLAYGEDGILPVVLLILIVNGLAEEMFFRGALFDLFDSHRPVLVTTLIYGISTIASANVMLIFAAVVLGYVVGRLRYVTGGVLAPMITHVTWSVTMLLALPPILG